MQDVSHFTEMFILSVCALGASHLLHISHVCVSFWTMIGSELLLTDDAWKLRFKVNRETFPLCTYTILHTVQNNIQVTKTSN